MKISNIDEFSPHGIQEITFNFGSYVGQPGVTVRFTDGTESTFYRTRHIDTLTIPFSGKSIHDLEEAIDKALGRLNAGRDYLMGVQRKDLSIEDAFEAFGFQRNGLR